MERGERDAWAVVTRYGNTLLGKQLAAYLDALGTVSLSRLTYRLTLFNVVYVGLLQRYLSQ